MVDVFRIRCSSIGKIMTSPKKGCAGLSKTAQSYCDMWLKEQLYNRKKSFSNKYTEKGVIVEDNSIDFIADQLGYPFLIKNDKRFYDDWMEGEPDILPLGDDLVIDAKNSWSWETFPLLEDEIPTTDYYWQLQGYMNLTGRSNAKLIYILSDTPTHLIEREAFFHCRNNGYDDLDIDVYKMFEDNMTYGDVPDNLKIKVFDVVRNNIEINSVKTRVEECREYIELKYKQLIK